MIQFFRNFFRDTYSSRDLIWDLAKRDFRSAYLGSVLGIFWIFIEPAFYMTIMWFFFSKALKFQPSSSAPYIPWLMSAMIQWYLISGGISSGVGAVKGHSYLIKKWGFNLSVLPVVTILTSLLSHLVFLGIFLILFLISGLSFSIHNFQIIYYVIATMIFLLGVSWITSSISLFLKDMRQLVQLLLQIGFWVSPIFWELATYPEEYRFLMKFNPTYHLMTGYRMSFIEHRVFWADYSSLIYFWIFTGFLLIAGGFIFNKLRPDIGDVL